MPLDQLDPRTPPKHPAPYSKQLLPIFDEVLKDVKTVLDPMAGIGRIHELAREGRKTVGIELEPEWASYHKDTICGDCNDVMAGMIDDGEQFGAIVVSPVFGNRMSDHFNAKDGSHRRTYKHYLGRDLTPGNSGVMYFGNEYKTFHIVSWFHAYMVLEDDGLFVLNCKDHWKTYQKKGMKIRERQEVCAFHVGVLEKLGLELMEKIVVKTPGYRYGANREDRCDEMVYVFKK